MATYKVRTGDREYTATVVDKAGGGASVTIEGQTFEVDSVGGPATAAPPVAAPGPAAVASTAPVASAAPAAPARSGAVVAPIPGKILAIKVKVGDEVRPSQVLLILEAMKMENNVPSPVGGTVKEIAVSEGSEVRTGQTLLVIE